MKIPDQVKTVSNFQFASIGTLAVLFCAVLVGVLINIWPVLVVATTLFILVMLVVYQYQRGLLLWQIFISFGIIAYAALNYGFANYSLSIFFNLPIGHLLVGFGMLLALFQSKKLLKSTFSEPAVWLSILLFFISLCHLVVDVPMKGMYAIRDANYAFEILLVICGFLWGVQRQYENAFVKTLLVLFVVAFLYSLTYPFKETLMQYSPVGGVFREVPLLGTYGAITFYLVLGGLFCFFVAPKLWPKYAYIFYILGFSQILWSFIFQDRSMYIGLVLGVALIVIFSRLGKLLKVLLVGGAMLLVGLLLGGIVELDGKGRVGGLSLEFFVEHIKSIFFLGESVGVETSRWRIDLWLGVLEAWKSSYSTMFFGLGFGEPLINFVMAGGVEVRQPHNTHLTVLARMGLIGFIVWILILTRIFYLLAMVVRHTAIGSLTRHTGLWFLAFYMIGLLLSSVQPWLEFSYGAVPFFIVIGYVVGWSTRVVERNNGI